MATADLDQQQPTSGRRLGTGEGAESTAARERKSSLQHPGQAFSPPPTGGDDGSAPPRPAVKHPVHRITAPGSVQALAVDDDVLFAGVQGGSIVAWSLETYELLATIPAHQESVLGLSLSEDHSLLFSTGADSVVNVWSTQTLQRLYSLHSTYEVGDVFCVAHSTKKQTVFYGAQNASIQWQRLSTDALVSSPASSSTSLGTFKHRFFDSLGPGGTVTLLQSEDGAIARIRNQGGHIVRVSKDNYLPYAHRSYIFSMVLVKGLFQHDREEEVLITGGGGGTIKLWGIDALTEQGLVQLEKYKNTESSVLSLTYRGSFLYAGLSDGTAHIYNLASHQLVQKLYVGHGDVSQVQVSNDSILCGTSEGWVKRYNNNFAETEAWQANEGKILAAGLITRRDHQILATGGSDNVVMFWDRERSALSTAAAARSNDELVNALRELVAYRTVAANPSCVRDCHEAVTFLRKMCNAFGATTTLLSPQEGVNPILLAQFSATKDASSSSSSHSRKTVLFYGHYDVVDAEVAPANWNANWVGDPFNLHPLNGYLYGRGVTDNKGPILAAIYAVADLAQHHALSCNVTFLLEGDEEAGSRGFRKTVQAHRRDIGKIDYILLSNSYWLDDHIPCLTFGMRGVVHASVTVSSNKPDLHSGMDGKSIQHEPLKDLTVLLASLVGPSGTKVTIPQFYEAVDDLDEAELQAYATITSALLPGHPEIENEKSFAISLMQRWRYPNLTVHRIEVPEAKTAVTISGSAKASLSIRIVPSQTAEQVAHSLTKYLHEQFRKLQSTNTLRVQITSKADPWLGDVRSQIYEALKSAITDVWNPDMVAVSQRSFPQPGDDTVETVPPLVQRRSPQRRASTLATHGTFTSDNTPREPLLIREGGSIPAISFLEHEFGAPAAMFPMGQASDNAHLDNERIRVENLYKGREVLKRVFSEL